MPCASGSQGSAVESKHMSKTIIVVPCYNEAKRILSDQFADFVDSCSDVDLLFVNDGSRDATAEVLDGLVARDPKRFSVLHQRTNRGKAEAVRVGMNEAFARGADFAGYFDADLSTPLCEIPRLLAILADRDETQLAMGARVQLLGRNIERNPLRHYLGRLFATLASLTLDLRVYDTQCGAKLFRVSPLTKAAFEAPFLSTWIFDVEIIARMITETRGTTVRIEDLICELPLTQWKDVAGSKVSILYFGRALVEMWRIYRRYLNRRGFRGRDRGPRSE